MGFTVLETVSEDPVGNNIFQDTKNYFAGKEIQSNPVWLMTQNYRILTLNFRR